MAPVNTPNQRKSLLNDPTIVLLIILSSWLVIFLTINWANQQKHESWQDAKSVCSFKRHYSSTDFTPIIAMTTMFLSQVFILIHLVLIEFATPVPIVFSRKNIICKSFALSATPRLSPIKRKLSRISITGFYCFTVLTIIMLALLSHEFSACFLVGNNRSPSVGQLMCIAFLTFFFLTVGVLWRFSTVSKLVVVLSDNQTLAVCARTGDLYVNLEEEQIEQIYEQSSRTSSFSDH